MIENRVTRREREKFEALAGAHQMRMRELMSSSLSLSPTPSAPPMNFRLPVHAMEVGG